MKKLFFLFLVFAASLWAQYPEEYANLSEKISMPTAIAMTAYNRPDYLQKTLTALARNPESQTLPILFLLDGGPNAKQKELIEIIDSFHFPHCFIIAFSENLGCERNMVGLRSFAFDYCSFEKVIVLEDDLLIPPNGIGLLLRMHEWAEKNIPQFGIVTLCSKIPVKEKKEKFLSFLTNPIRKKLPKKKGNTTKGHYQNMQDSPQNAIYYHTPPYWVYCMSRDVWGKIRDIELESLALFADPKNPRYLDHPAVRHWMLKKLLEAKPLLNKTGSAILGNPHFITMDSGQDGVLDIALRACGLRYIAPAVNRIENIGEYGVHFSPGIWRFFCKDLHLGVFPQDTSLSKFSFVEKVAL